MFQRFCGGSSKGMNKQLCKKLREKKKNWGRGGGRGMSFRATIYLSELRTHYNILMTSVQISIKGKSALQQANHLHQSWVGLSAGGGWILLRCIFLLNNFGVIVGVHMWNDGAALEVRQCSRVVLMFKDVWTIGMLVWVLWNRDNAEKKMRHQRGVDVQSWLRLWSSDANRQQGQSVRFRILVEDVVVETASVLLSGLCGWTAFTVCRTQVRTVPHVFCSSIHSPARKRTLTMWLYTGTTSSLSGSFLVIVEKHWPSFFNRTYSRKLCPATFRRGSAVIRLNIKGRNGPDLTSGLNCGHNLASVDSWCSTELD